MAEPEEELVGQPEVTRVTAVVYDESHYEEYELQSLDDWTACSEKEGVVWIDVTGLGAPWPLEMAASCFGLHPLIQEDILNIDQRPKIDYFANYVFVVLKSLMLDAGTETILHGQSSIVLGTNYVLSFHDLDRDTYAPIRQRIRHAKGRIRSLGCDYLAHALIDLVVDNYIQTLEFLGEKLEALEEEVVERPTKETLPLIHDMKQEMIELRRSVWPLREVVGSLSRRETPLIGDATIIYFRDVYDHAFQVMDTIETFRDMISGMLDIYLSSISNRMNEIMKVLTIVSTVFIPLTFVSGVYGMNFDFMPELRWRYGYPMVLGVMLIALIGMLAVFHKKRWI
ncbi:MAG: magnesium/cobalt transporter CorA [Chloroflexi bacterium]|nr:magnesium/cobalt transporter CorA [Chloroflexota bacterium]